MIASRTTLAIVVLGLVLVGAIATAPAAAQNNETDGNASAVVEDLGDLRVHDYEYVDGEFTIDATWRGSAPTTVTAVEMLELNEAGSAQISFKQVRVAPDERVEISMPVAQRSGGTAAVMLTTSHSIDAGDALVLQAGDAGDREPIPFNLASMLVALAAAGGAGASFAMTRRHYQEDEDDPRRERIA